MNTYSFSMLLFLLAYFCPQIWSSDLLPECEYWAKNEKFPLTPSLTLFPSHFRKQTMIQCHEKPQIMWSICTKSCYKYSKDLHSSCAIWSKQGECSINPNYMQIYCPKSCGHSITWNPFYRTKLGLTNFTLSTNILEHLLQPCQIPNNILNIADILMDRLYLLSTGNADLLWSFSQQSPLEFYYSIGIVEIMTYILKIHELVYISYHRTQEAKEVSDQLVKMQTTLLEQLQTTIPEGSTTISSKLLNVIGGVSGSSKSTYLENEIEDVSLEKVNVYVEKITSLISQWIIAVQVHNERIHEFYKTQSKGNDDLFQRDENDGWGATEENKQSKVLLSLNQCFHYEKVELTKLIYHYFQECDQSKGYCIDSKADFAVPTFVHEPTIPSPPPSAGVQDENELPIPPSDFSTRKFPSFPSRNNLVPYHKLSNDLTIPKLGVGINNNINIDEIMIALTDAIDLGYRLFDITIDDPNVDVAIGNTLQTIFETDLVKREEIYVMIKFMNHSLPEGTDVHSKSERASGYSDHVQEHVQKRLQLLQLSYVDILLLDTPPISSREEGWIWEGMSILYEHRLVNALGLCNYDSFSINRLLSSLPSNGVPPMILYNKIDIYHYGSLSSPLVSTVEEWNDLLFLSEEYNLMLMGYSPFSGYPYLLKPLYDPVIQYIANRHTLFSYNHTSTAYKRNARTKQTPADSRTSRPQVPITSPTSLKDSKDNRQANSPWNSFAEVGTDGRAHSDPASSTSSNTIPNSQFTELPKSLVVTPAQILLRYFLEQNIGMIFSSYSYDHLQENQKVFEILPLTNYEKSLIESLQYIVGNYQYLVR